MQAPKHAGVRFFLRFSKLRVEQGLVFAGHGYGHGPGGLVCIQDGAPAEWPLPELVGALQHTQQPALRLAAIFHGRVEQRSGERVRRLENIEPNETATHRFFEYRL